MPRYTSAQAPAWCAGGSLLVLALSAGIACNGLTVELDPEDAPGAGGVGASDSAGGAASGGGIASAGTGGTFVPPWLPCDPRPYNEHEIECAETGNWSPMCSAVTTSNWRGCRATGCGVCVELIEVEFPYYLSHHPCCETNETCDENYHACSWLCPEPEDYDKVPKCPDVSRPGDRRDE